MTSDTQEKIWQIDKGLADLSARNLVITRLHSNGTLEAVECTAQTSEIGNKIAELRHEGKKKLVEDEDEE